MESVILHVGGHKTASSMIQSQLRMDREKLKENISIIFREEMMSHPFYAQMKKAIESKGGEGSIVNQGFDANPHLLFTNEDMLSALSLSGFFRNAKYGVEYIKKMFPGREVRIILYTRNQIEYIESVYLQQLHMGRVLEFKDFISRQPIDKIRWFGVCESLSELDGVKLEVVPYESINVVGVDEYYRNFLRLVGVVDAEKFNVDQDKMGGRKANRSFAQKAIDIFNRVYDLLDEDEMKVMRVFLQNNFSTKNYPRPELFSGGQKKELMQSYRYDNELLFDEYLSEYRELSSHYFNC